MEKQDKGRPLPKFGEWDVNDPSSAEGFTVIFNKARDEKKTGGGTKTGSTPRNDSKNRNALGKPSVSSRSRSPFHGFIHYSHINVM